MSKRTANRSLSEEEKQLWAKVQRTVAPLDPEVRPESVAIEAAPPAIIEAAALKKTPKTKPPAAAAKKPPAPKPPAPGALDHKTRTRLARGANSVGGTIDLHGMRQDEAHRALRAFLARCQMRGDRFAIVVTGKGSRSYERDHSSFRQRGVLRTAVPQWFATDIFRDLVVGYSEASPSHGGSGALYVQIRRRRTPASNRGKNNATHGGRQ